MDGPQKTMFFGNISKNTNYFFLIFFGPLRRLFKTFFGEKIFFVWKFYFFFLISHNIFSKDFFDFLIKIWIFDKKIIFLPQLFFKVGKVEDFPKELEKWKIFRFIGNFSTTANIPNNSILEETCRFFSKLENFPPSANVPIHLILLEKFPPSPIGLKIGKLENFPIYWKIFRCFQIGKISTFCKCSYSSDFTGKISTFSNRSENWHTSGPG